MENEKNNGNVGVAQPETMDSPIIDGPFSMPIPEGSVESIEPVTPDIPTPDTVEPSPAENTDVSANQPSGVDSIDASSVTDSTVVSEPVPSLETPIEAPGVQEVVSNPVPEVSVAGQPVVTNEPIASSEVNQPITPVEQPSSSLPSEAVPNDTEVFQAQQLAPTSEPSVGMAAPDSLAQPPLQLDPSLNVQAIEPAIDEINAAKKKKKGKKGGGILGFFLFIILLIAGGLAFYKFYILKPEKKYDKFFDVYQKNVENFLKATVTPIEKTMMVSGDLAFESNYEELKGINSFDLNYKIGVDFENEKLEMQGKLAENNREVFNAITYLVNNKLYLSSSKVYDKLLMIADVGDQIDISEIFSQTKPSDISYMINSINTYMIKALEKADYSSKETKIDINGKSIFVSDSILTINEKNYQSILKAFAEGMKNDTKLIEVLSSISDTDKDTIIAYMDTIGSDVECSEDVECTDNIPRPFETKIELYTDLITTKFAGLKVSRDNETVIDLVYDDQTVILKGNNYSLKAISTDGKKYDVTLSLGDEEYTATVTKNTESNYTIETIIQEVNVKVTIGYEVSETVITKNIGLEAKYEDIYFKVKYDSKTEYNVEIANIDINNAVVYDQLSDEEKEKIITNIDKAIDDSALYKDLYDMFNPSYQTPDYSVTDVPAACSYATCDNCSGNTCECEYLDEDWKLATVTCPRNY